MLSRLFATALLLALCAFPAAAHDTRPERPNIVLILGDDLGSRDMGFQGSREIPTPNIDRIAAEGVSFPQAYATHQVCGPSRAGLMTGKYPQRFGYEYNNVRQLVSPASKLPFEDMGLPLTEATMADRLRALGYRTAAYGKWHLGVAERYHPLNRGFDEFYGFLGGSRSYFAFSDSNPVTRPEDRMERGNGVFEEFEGYLTDVLAAEGAGFIARNKKQPFFLYMSFNATHAPMESLPEDRAAFPNLTGIRLEQAAMMRALDRGVGVLLEALEREGLAKNTIVVFTDDNGGSTSVNAGVNYPYAGEKATHLEGGFRVPMAIRWPGKIAAASSYQYPVSLIDLLPTFVDAAGGDVAKLAPIDGVSLWPYLSGANPDRPHQRLYWKRDVRGTIRDGDWKLMRFPDRPAELYNLVDDPGEQADLASENPELVRQLFKALFAWEVTLERPLWMRTTDVEARDMEIHEYYRVPEEFFRPLEREPSSSTAP